MKKECFLRVLAIMKKLRVEYARLHPLAFWNYYRDFNVRWMLRDVRRVFVMAYRACQPHAASQQQAVALASKPQAASLGCLQDEEEAEWKKPVCYTVWMTGILHYRDTSWCSGQRCC